VLNVRAAKIEINPATFKQEPITRLVKITFFIEIVFLKEKSCIFAEPMIKSL
jgi:hypothetical protein